MDHARLPAAATPEKLEPFDHARQARERFDVVVADDTQDRDASLEELLDPRFEGTKGFEASVGAFDDVAGKEHGVDMGLDSVIDGRLEGELGSEGPGIDSKILKVLGKTRGPGSQVDVADSQQAEIAFRGCSWSGGLGQGGGPFAGVFWLPLPTR
jgi:hypothetical protein